MTRHLPRLREGDFSAALPADPTGDEVAELRDALDEVTRQLAAARDRQERLIANAAHEIQTPLACMRTTVDLALFRQRTLEETRQALEEARSEIDRLSALARNLLDLAAAGKVGMDQEELALDEVVRRAAEAFRAHAAQRGITLQIEAPSAGAVRGSAAGLRQAIDNLLGNAVKFSPAGGAVTVTVSVDAGRGLASVVVSDQGPGVPEAEREKIFDPFYRTRKGGGGTGLGLAIARDIARQHGGELTLLSSPRGARFVLDLPLRSAGGEANTRQRASAS